MKEKFNSLLTRARTGTKTPFWSEVSKDKANSLYAAGKKTRLLLFTNSISIGGLEEHVELLARHIDRTKFVVYSISPEWEPTKEFSHTLAKLSDASTEITPDRRYGLLKELKEAVRFYHKLREWKIQVVHMHSTTYSGQFMSFVAARLAGVRKVYVTEHLAPHGGLPWLKKWARNIFTILIDGTICVSQKNYQARLKYIFTPKDRTFVVNNGVDLDDFPPIPEPVLKDLREKVGIPEQAQIIGTVVRFEPEKGLNYLIEAAPAIKAACPEAYFLMVGDGSLRSELEASVARLGLSDSFRFVGFQSDPRPYLGLIDIFVLPVPLGSMSIGLLEAMAMQCAIVMTFGGPGEAVIHGETGLCAEPANPHAIAEAVIKILESPTLRKTLGEAARQHIEAEFSAARVARTLEKLYLKG